MSYKSENWKDKLDEVRNYVEPRKEGTVEQTAEDVISDEIDRLITHLEEEVGVDEEKGEKVPCPHCDGKGYHIKEDTLPEVPVVEETFQKTVEKLTEKNMLGRLAKSLRLNEQGKDQLFDYFQNGDLKQ
tara:strand:+ start:28 stop:414 length:387 start_codon:yes stop_codon:yes gene_type:complete